MARAKSKTDETTRERVLRSAIERFAEKGFHGTGIRDLAEAAGLTTSALYYYMANKDDLLVEIMIGAITPLRDAAARIVVELPDPAKALCVIVEHHVWLHATDRLACIVTDTEVRALSGERRERVLQLRDEYESLWRQVLAEGRKVGVFHVEDAGLAARALLQMATGVSHWFSPKGSLGLDDLCRTYSDGALGFLRARAADGNMVTRAALQLPPPNHFLAPIVTSDQVSH